MAPKEVLIQRLNKLRWDTIDAGERGISGAALMTAAEAAIHFLLAATLAGGVVFQNFAPFGVAIVAGAGAGLCGGAALLGAALGYLTLLGFSEGLRYLSASILTFSVAFAFHDIPLLRRSWSMPLVAGLVNGCAGFIYLSRHVWTPEQVIFFSCEVILTVLVSWACRVVLLPVRNGRAEGKLSLERRTGAVILLCAVLVSLSSLFVLNSISIGRSLAAVMVLAATWRGGMAPGAILGIAAGLSLDVAGMGTPLYTMAYGVAALAAGICRDRSRLTAAVCYVLGNAAAVLWTWSAALPLSILYEAFLGAAVFMLLPMPWLKRLNALLPQTGTVPSDSKGLERTRRKIELSSAAFRTLCDSLRAGLRPPENNNDVASVFDRAAMRVCRSCSLRGKCWERDYITTFNALNDATAAMLDRGRGEAEDFPRHFSDRCIHFPAFLAAVNSELTGLLYRRQYNSRIRESRAAVMRQYSQLSTLLDDMAVELGQELVPALTEERRLHQHLAAQGLEAEVSAYRDPRGLLRAEIRGEASESLSRPKQLAALSQLLKVPLRGERVEDVTMLIQLEPLVAVAGVAARKKDGETVSGDAGTYFKREDGILYLLLCDGMGSGPQAHRESSLAVRLLEQFLQAGVQAEQTLVTLSSALGLRGDETGGFTTVDLLEINLFSGECVVYKLGAAPTYIRRGDSVRRITGNSLPAGMGTAEPSVPDKTRLRLEPGDCVLMVSDGVVGSDDAWLQSQLAAFDGESPKNLACRLITDSPEESTDDRTALVVRIGKRT